MILQIGGLDPRSPVGGIVRFIRGLIQPEKVKQEQLLDEVSRNPAKGRAIADSIRTEQFNFREGLKGAQGLEAAKRADPNFKPSDAGDQRPQRGPGQILGPQATTGEAQAESTFNPLAAIAAAEGLNPDDPGSAEILLAIAARFPSTIEGEVLDIDRLEGGARRNVLADVAADEQAVAESELATSRATFLTEVIEGVDARGGVLLKIEEEIGGTQLGIATNTLQIHEAKVGLELSELHTNAYMKMFAAASPAEQNWMAVAVQNPNYLVSLDRAKERTLRALIASANLRARNVETAIERTTAIMQMFDRASFVTKNLQDALGTEENPGRDDLVLASGTQFNDYWRAVAGDPFMSSILTPMIFSLETGEVTAIAPEQGRPAGPRQLGVEPGAPTTERDPRNILEAETEPRIRAGISQKTDTAFAILGSVPLEERGALAEKISAAFGLESTELPGVTVRDLMIQRALWAPFVRDLSLIVGGKPQQELLKVENRAKEVAVKKLLREEYGINVDRAGGKQ